MSKYIVSVILFSIMCGFTPAHATDKHSHMVSDWRLHKPFLHGLSQGMSLGLLTPTPDTWPVATPADLLQYPSVIATHLYEHGAFARYSGRIAGLSAWLYLGYLCWRWRVIRRTRVMVVS